MLYHFFKKKVNWSDPSRLAVHPLYTKRLLCRRRPSQTLGLEPQMPAFLFQTLG